jgi:hypothetical protein
VPIGSGYSFVTNERAIRVGLWIAPLLTGLLALQLGKSAGYDFQVYHYFNGYAFLTGRMTPDILPAGRQTFLNPVADGFLYALIENFPARFCGFILGAVHGLNLIVAAAIASCVLSRADLGAFIPGLLAAAGFLGWENLNLLGSFHHDNLVSIFFLVSLLIVCRQAQATDSTSTTKFEWQAAAGVCIGVGLGLKLTLAPFALAIGCAPMFYPWPVWRRLQAMTVSAAAGAAGLLAVAGPHMWHLYREYGNPIFPFFRWLSRPPFDQIAEQQDLRFVPTGVAEYLFYPFYFVFNPLRTDAVVFQDFRLPITYAAALIYLVVLVWRWVTRQQAGGGLVKSVWRLAPEATVFLGVVAISYAGWLCVFGYYRYVLPIELLSFIVLAVLLFDCLGQRRGSITLIALALLIVPTTRGFDSERRLWGNQRFVETELPSVPQIRPDAIVLIGGPDAGSYFIPKFPASVRFLGIDVIDDYIPHSGQSGGSPVPDTMLGPFREMMHKAVSEHSGQVLGVFREDDAARARGAFSSYGFVTAMESCGTIRSNVASGDPLYLCELMRAPAT